MVDKLPWLILFAPFGAAVIICLFFMKSPKAAGLIAVAAILVSFASSLRLFVFYLNQPSLLPIETSLAWIQGGGPSTSLGIHLTVDFGFLLDRLSILMLLIVSGVSGCIFFYSLGYMKGDSSFPRYFASLSLFAFSMIGIVLANNFLMLFVFWELVAVSSYLLIGFWFEKPAAADAGNKAFIVNRLADFGFVLGIFYVWMLSGLGGGARTFSFSRLSEFIPQAAQAGLVSESMMVLAALLIFCGVVGKSAQFPLYIWLPDAMEGPTPVSALIHAATMVAAGIYLLSRTFFLVAGLPQALAVIAWTGVITAILAAGLAMIQNDIKKILAYSTISQLGYMVMAVGLGSSTVAMYHLGTHAFFKALLFLGAGAMIHSLHTQDIWEMGGLLKPMPVTSVTFLIGALALAGIYPLSGFFSKDEILALAHDQNPAVYVLALGAAGLTAFYMTRTVWVALLGPRRMPTHGHGPIHEAPVVMQGPLIVLAFFSMVAGFLGIPEFLTGHPTHEGLKFAVAVTASAISLGGILLGSFVYAKLKTKQDPLTRLLGRLYGVLAQKYCLDEFFLGLAGLFQNALAGILDSFDRNVVIQKGVNGAAKTTAGLGSFLRRAQTGRIETYATVFIFGVIALVYFLS